MNLGHEAAEYMHLGNTTNQAIARACLESKTELNPTEYNVVYIITKSVFEEQLLHAYYYSKTVTPVDGLN
jgi:hypothetical protein